LANKKPCKIPIIAANIALINETNKLVYKESQPVSLLKCSNVKVLFTPIIFTNEPNTTIINISKIKAEKIVLIVVTTNFVDLVSGMLKELEPPLIVPVSLSLRK